MFNLSKTLLFLTNFIFSPEIYSLKLGEANNETYEQIYMWLTKIKEPLNQMRKKYNKSVMVMEC